MLSQAAQYSVRAHSVAESLRLVPAPAAAQIPSSAVIHIELTLTVANAPKGVLFSLGPSTSLRQRHGKSALQGTVEATMAVSVAEA